MPDYDDRRAHISALSSLPAHPLGGLRGGLPMLARKRCSMIFRSHQSEGDIAPTLENT